MKVKSIQTNDNRLKQPILYCHKLFYGARNLLIDIQYGASLAGYKKTNYNGFKWVVNTDYSVLSSIFEHRILPGDVIVDVGCGKGRVINWILHQGYQNKIIGIEYDKETFDKLNSRLNRFENVTLIHGDALENIPEDATLFYLFNPFNEKVMEKFSQKLKKVFQNMKDIRILYYRPLHLNVFQQDNAWKVTEFEMDLDFRFKDLSSHRKYAVIEFYQ